MKIRQHVFLMAIVITFAVTAVAQVSDDQQTQNALKGGEKVSTALETVTSTAISPLVGVGAVGAPVSTITRPSFSAIGSLSCRSQSSGSQFFCCWRSSSSKKRLVGSHRSLLFCYRRLLLGPQKTISVGRSETFAVGQGVFSPPLLCPSQPAREIK
jgi:hypothetical protein